MTEPSPHQPLFSIVMPAYNAQRFIAEAVGSVIGQTFPDWELIVVDDGSTDNTSDTVTMTAAGDSRIRLHRSPTNSGSAYLPRRQAIMLSSGQYVVSLDADDSLDPHFLEKTARHIEASAPDCVYCIMTIGDDGKHLPVEGIDTSRCYAGHELVKETLGSWRIGANGLCVRRSVYLRVFGEDDEFSAGINADELLTRRLMFETQKAVFSDAVYHYRLTPTSISRRPGAGTFDILNTDIALKKLVDEHFAAGSEERHRMAEMMVRDTLDMLHLLVANRNNRFINTPFIRDRIDSCRKSIDFSELKGTPGWLKRNLLRTGLQPLKTIMLLHDTFKRRK